MTENNDTVTVGGCINEPVIFSRRIHLKLGHRFHALLKVCSDHDDTVLLSVLHYSHEVHNMVTTVCELIQD